MIMFLLRHWKAVTGIAIALGGPMILASWGFVLTTSRTNATIPMHEARIQNLEQYNYENKALLTSIRDSQIRAEERVFKELKEARQARQVVK